METIFLVIVATGEYEDYYEHKIFATKDKEKAQLWVRKFNRIITLYSKMINEWEIDYEDENQPLPLWWDCVAWEMNSPNAFTREINYRE